MKTIISLLTLLNLVAFGSQPAKPIRLPVNNQPISLGLCLSQDKSFYTYATLFEETNTYFVSCGHDNFYPKTGEEIVFGNGDKRIVKNIWIIGTSWSSTTFDLVVGELYEPVNTTLSKTWWHLPTSFFTEKSVCGFALDGFYTGSSVYTKQVGNTEFIRTENLTATVVDGYSGSPVWHNERLIGVTFGTFWPYKNSMVTPIFMALIKCQEKFPAKFQTLNKETKLSIFDIDNTTKSLILDLAPGNDYQIGLSANLIDWVNSGTITEFSQDDTESFPWKRKYFFDSTNHKSMFFRGEKIF